MLGASYATVPRIHLDEPLGWLESLFSMGRRRERPS